MSLILDGTNGLTFNNATTQASAALVVGTASAITAGTSVASTSGTSIDFTSIPNWVKRITIMLNGVSLNGTANLLVQIGTGGTPTTTGYVSQTCYGIIASSQTGGATSTTGYVAFFGAASYAVSGSMVLTNISGNTWISSSVVGNTVTTGYVAMGTGTGSLASVLNLVRITTTTGTDTFDAGSINILYE